jgi:hypothetical protein
MSPGEAEAWAWTERDCGKEASIRRILAGRTSWLLAFIVIFVTGIEDNRSRAKHSPSNLNMEV